MAHYPTYQSRERTWSLETAAISSDFNIGRWQARQSMGALSAGYLFQ